MTTKIPEALDTKIEQLVREHLALQQAAARAAVERAFAASTPARATTWRRTTYTRRVSSTMAELAEHLFQAVQACPGETMTAIAAQVGEEARALHRPMMHLKEGRDLMLSRELVRV